MNFEIRGVHCAIEAGRKQKKTIVMGVVYIELDKGNE